MSDPNLAAAPLPPIAVEHLPDDSVVLKLPHPLGPTQHAERIPSFPPHKARATAGGHYPGSQRLAGQTQ
jgi:hypothetical protein